MKKNIIQQAKLINKQNKLLNDLDVWCEKNNVDTMNEHYQKALTDLFMGDENTLINYLQYYHEQMSLFDDEQ